MKAKDLIAELSKLDPECDVMVELLGNEKGEKETSVIHGRIGRIEYTRRCVAGENDPWSRFGIVWGWIYSIETFTGV